MMVLQTISGKTGKTFFMLVLDPGNIERLKAGKPILKNLSDINPEFIFDFAVAYTPDMHFLMDRIKMGIEVTDALEESLKMPESVDYEWLAEENHVEFIRNETRKKNGL
jgi:hypothetical protein